MDDHFLVLQTQKGNKEAFRILVTRYQRPILKYLSGFALPRQQVDEIAQEVFFRIYKNIDQYDLSREGKFSSWLFIIAKNLAINELSRYSIRNEISDDQTLEEATDDSIDVLSQLEQGQRKKILLDCVASLPVIYKKALALTQLKELSISEVARIEGVTEGTIKSRVFRGKELLRAELLKKQRLGL